MTAFRSVSFHAVVRIVSAGALGCLALALSAATGPEASALETTELAQNTGERQPERLDARADVEPREVKPAGYKVQQWPPEDWRDVHAERIRFLMINSGR